jgi:hypothetical protein
MKVTAFWDVPMCNPIFINILEEPAASIFTVYTYMKLRTSLQKAFIFMVKR